MATKKDTIAFALISEFQKRYRARYGKSVEINKYKEKWAAHDLIESFGYDRCLVALDAQFAYDCPHTWVYFARNCDRLLEYLDQVERDLEERRVARELARKWLSE